MLAVFTAVFVLTLWPQIETGRSLTYSKRAALFLAPPKKSSFPSTLLFYTIFFALALTVHVGSTPSSANIFYKLRLCLLSDQKRNFLPPTLVNF